MPAKKKPAGQAKAARKVTAKKAPAKKAAKPKDKTVPPKIGRPSKYSEAIADEICQKLSIGIPLAEICRDEKMPAYRTTYDWMDAHPTFSASIARAREEGYDAIAIDCLHISDDNGSDTRFTKDGEEMVNTDVIQRAKLRVDTRLKLLAKWSPKKYGDNINVGAGEGDQKVKITVTIGGNVDD